MADLAALSPVSPLNSMSGASGGPAGAPTAHESAAFAHAVADTAPVQTVAAEQAVAPLPSQPSGEALSTTLGHGFDAFAKQVQTAGHSAGAAVTDGPAFKASSADFKQVVGDAMQSMQGAYAFAIETTMASRGSTETTKIFNTLLKGQ